MKKSLLLESILVAVVLGSIVSANAAIKDLKFYVGAGLDYNIYSYNVNAKAPDLKIKGNGLGLLVPIIGVMIFFYLTFYLFLDLLL